MPDDEALHDDADHPYEKRAGDHRGDERSRRLERYIARIATEHEHRAVREVQHAQRAVDDRESRADEGKQRAERQAVEQLRKEIGPSDHGSLRAVASGSHVRPRAARLAPQAAVAARDANPYFRNLSVIAQVAAERVRLL